MPLTIQELHSALVTPADRLASVLRSQEVIAFLNAADDALKRLPLLDDATAKIAVLEERQKKAGEREGRLQQQMAAVISGSEELKRENESLRQQLVAMRDHPDVRRAERERVAAQLAELQRQHDALADPPAAVPTAPAASPVDAVIPTAE